MQIVLNGLEKDVPEGATVAALLDFLGEPEKHVLVEVNGAFIRFKEYTSKKLAPQDRVEVIYPAFGG